MIKYLIIIVYILLSLTVRANDEAIAAVLILEAGGESDSRAMAAVYEVIRNRAVKRHLTLDQIIFQPKQFSCLNGRNIQEAINKAKSHKKWQKALNIVKNKEKTNYIGAADHYFSIDIAPPYWIRYMTLVKQIGKHKFYV